MLHGCKALPEVLLSRTLSVIGSAERSCEVVHRQSWYRVIVAVAMGFSLSHFPPYFSWQIRWHFLNCDIERRQPFRNDMCPWQVVQPAGPSPRRCGATGPYSESVMRVVYLDDGAESVEVGTHF